MESWIIWVIVAAVLGVAELLEQLGRCRALPRPPRRQSKLIRFNQIGCPGGMHVENGNQRHRLGHFEFDIVTNSNQHKSPLRLHMAGHQWHAAVGLA